MTDHPSDKTIQLHLDEELPATERMEIRSHLAGCAECRGRAERYETLRAEIGGLPRSIEPPVDLWPGIAERIAAGGRGPALARRRIVPRWGGAVGAALVAGAAALAVGIQLGRQLPRPELPAAAAGPPAGQSAAVLTSYDDVDYDAAVADLEAILTAMRSELRPETVAAVESNLAIIDAAIADAREALLADPANEQLHRHLMTNMQMKLGLLRMVAGAATTEI